MGKKTASHASDIVVEVEDVLNDSEFEGSGNSTDIYILGDVTDAMYSKVLIPMMKLDEEGTAFKIYLDTFGGDLSVALAIGSFLDRVKVPVKIYLLGDVMSAGMVIAMGGRDNPNVVTYATKYTLGLIHSGSVGFEEAPLSLIKNAFQFHFEHFEPLFKRYVREHTNMPDEEIEKAFSCDYYLTSDQMVVYGIVDEII